MNDDKPFPPIEMFEVLASTLDSIHQAAGDGAPEWTTHIALEQTRGGGQQARAWWSPSGAGLWMSTLLRPKCDRSIWGGIALVAGAATRRALTALGADEIELRWPNDLYARSRKLGGILAESKDQSAGAWISLGIGINIDLKNEELIEKAPDGLSDRIICLREVSPAAESDPGKIALAIIEELRPLYGQFQQGEKLGDILGGDLSVAGREVLVERPGKPVLRGTATGIGSHGELTVVDEEGTTHELVAAEVTWDC